MIIAQNLATAGAVNTGYGWQCMYCIVECYSKMYVMYAFLIKNMHTCMDLYVKLIFKVQYPKYIYHVTSSRSVNYATLII
jgi:hypothetical protein